MAQKLSDQRYEEIPIASLQPHPNNPRQGDVASIAESIDTNGFFGAVIAQRSTGYILAGNHTWMAAKNAGMETIPTIWVDVDDARALRILLADNRTSDRAGYDKDALADVLRIASEAGSLTGTGYNKSDMSKLLKTLAERADDQTDQLKPQYSVIVDCQDEAHQLQVIEKLQKMKLQPRALIA